MSKQMIVLIGSPSSGKTTYARCLAKQGYKHIDWDSLHQYSARVNTKSYMYKLFLRLQDLIGNADKVVLDGYMNSADLKEKELSLFFADYEVEVRVMVVPMWVIVPRRAARGVLDWSDVATIDRDYSAAIPYLIDCASTVFVDTRDYLFDTVNIRTEEEFKSYWCSINTKPSEQAKKDFIDWIQTVKTYDVPYGDIDLLPYTYRGYSKTVLTWEVLRKMVSFIDKRVCEVGCFHGYLSFKAWESGAASVIAIDNHPEVIANVRKIRDLLQYPVSFKHADAMEIEVCDLALVMNVFHHLTDKSGFLIECFSKCKEVVFETHADLFALIGTMATTHGFVEKSRVVSHRPDNRLIVHYAKEGV